MVEIDESTRFEKSLAEIETKTRKLGKPFDKDQALYGIHEAVYHYEQVQKRCDNRLKPAQRNKHYADLLKAVRTARRLYEKLVNKAELIDPLVWVFEEAWEEAWDVATEEKAWDVATEEVEEYVDEATALLKIQEVFLKKAHAEAKAVDGRKGRQKSPGLYTLVNLLANTWEKQTQKRAGVSHPSKTDSKNSKSAFGPFPRFVKHVIEAADLEPASDNLGEFIAGVLRRRDREQAEGYMKKSLMDELGPPCRESSDQS